MHLTGVMIIQQQQLRQNHQGKKRHGHQLDGGRHRRGKMDLAASLTARGIQLTASQKSQLAQLQRQKKATRNDIYTPEQKQKMQNARAKWKSLNLSAAQQEQLRVIRREARQERASILTPEQRQQLQQKRPQMRQHKWG